MGCWYKTCGLSHLHILGGAKVYVFAIEQNLHHDRCYTTAFWKPVMLPFLAEYNDYGAGENSHSNINFVIEGIKSRLIEMPLGENECHDIAVSADQLDEELFFNAVHEGRLFVKGYHGERAQVDVVMMRADIVDNICENWELEMYVGDGKGTGGYQNNYISYKFKDIVAKVPDFLDKVEAEINDIRDSTDTMPVDFRFSCLKNTISELYNFKDRNLVSIYLGSISNHRYSRIVRPTDIVVDYLVNGKRLEAEALLVDVLRGSFIDTFMEVSRITWAPGAHEGSQSQEHSSYRALCNAVSAALDNEYAEYSSDE